MDERIVRWREDVEGWEWVYAPEIVGVGKDKTMANFTLLVVVQTLIK